MRRLMLALAAVAVIAGCDRVPTAPAHAAPIVPAKIDCRSGYVVTSGRDTVCVGGTLSTKP